MPHKIPPQMGNKHEILKRSTLERDQDLEFVERWFREGRTVRYMVETLSAMRPYEVKAAMVQRDIAAVRAEWLRRAADYMTSFMEGQLERVRFLQREALMEYERSKGETTERREKRTIVSVQQQTDKDGKAPSDWRFDYDEEDDEDDNTPTAEAPLEGIVTAGEVTTTKKERIGDVRFLELYLRLLREEREIVGYDPKAPAKRGRETVVKVLLPDAADIEAEDMDDENEED